MLLYRTGASVSSLMKGCSRKYEAMGHFCRSREVRKIWSVTAFRCIDSNDTFQISGSHS